jgi:HEAT repeat protein
VALGLLEARESLCELTARADESGHDSFLSLQLARGLALLGDPAIVPALIERIAESASLPQTASAARALGMLGDGSAIPALVALLDVKEHGAQRAAVAAIALGLLAEKSDLPWNVGFRADGNYLAHGPALVQVVMTL